ncbi:LysR substrate-binding domain-containing protein [Alloalcanivorax xenomutans]|uniref:LysR substrate-binding domain-containing protein n=1 Tax=Alloalcanivorax xenomutans TaxID=1094342 RepID=UPI00300B946F
MNETTLKQWRLFLAVAETGSVAAAAERVALTQPAVSQGLAQLEQRLDARLFDRVGRGLVLNDRGRALIPEARALLTQLARCERLFQSPPLEVMLAATHTLGNYYLPPLLSTFRQRHPRARVRMDVVNTRQAVALLLELKVDLALVEGPVSHALLRVRHWRDDVLLRVAAPSVVETLKPDPAHWPWVMRELGSGTRAVIERSLGADFPEPERILELGAGEAVRQALMAGAGVGYVSETSVSAALADGRLGTVPGPHQRLVRPLYWVRHARHEPGAGETALGAVLREAVP